MMLVAELSFGMGVCPHALNHSRRMEYSGLNSGAKVQSPWAQGIPGRLEQGLETGSSTRTNMLTHMHSRSALPPPMLLEAEELG